MSQRSRADWTKLKIVKITRYVRKRRDREYVEYKMTAPPGSKALFVPVTGRKLRETIGEFGRAYLLIVDPDEHTVAFLDSLGFDIDIEIVLDKAKPVSAKRTQ